MPNAVEFVRPNLVVIPACPKKRCGWAILSPRGIPRSRRTQRECLRHLLGRRSLSYRRIHSTIASCRCPRLVGECDGRTNEANSADAFAAARVSNGQETKPEEADKRPCKIVRFATHLPEEPLHNELPLPSRRRTLRSVARQSVPRMAAPKALRRHSKYASIGTPIALQ
jgi:hypothetical protein